MKVTSKNTDKQITDFSCFAVDRALRLISTDIIKITPIQESNLLMLVRNKQTADRFLKTKNLPGICYIECSLHDSLNFVKGTIYAPYLVNIPEDEIIAELKPQNVHSIFKFTKLIDGTPKETGVILITLGSFRHLIACGRVFNSAPVKQKIEAVK